MNATDSSVDWKFSPRRQQHEIKDLSVDADKMPIAFCRTSQYFQPGCDIGCVILAGLKSKLQIGAQERGPEVGNQFLDSVTFAPEAMSAKITVEPGLAACPVGAFVGKRRVITVRVLETLEWRHLDRVSCDAIKRTISAMSDGCSKAAKYFSA